MIMITTVKIATIMSIMTKRGGTVMTASGKIVLATEEKQIDNLTIFKLILNPY